MTQGRRFFSLALLVLPAACTLDRLSLTADSRGSDTGAIRFSYVSGDCLFGCSVGPMMTGTAEVLSAALPSAARAPTITVDDPTVVGASIESIACTAADGTTGSGVSCSAKGATEGVTINITALRAGTTKLRVMQGATEIDGIDLTVSAPAAISMSCTPSQTIEVGSSCVLGWNVTDSDGHGLQASSGVSVQTNDTSVAGVEAPFTTTPSSSVSDAEVGLFSTPDVVGVKAGQTSVLAVADGVTGRLAITVSGK